MYTRVKNAEEIAHMRTSGEITAYILAQIHQIAQEGITGNEIDDFVKKEAILAGVQCAFKGYNGFPGHICISKNDEVVHGIPDDTPFKKGDLISFDFGIACHGMITDSAFTMVIGQEIPHETRRLIEQTEASLYAGLEAIQAGGKVGDISSAIQQVLSSAKLGIFKELVGHGVGHEVHELPDIPNYGQADRGFTLEKNMTIAIEPMAALGKAHIKTDDDGWTIRTIDSSLAAHFEHTVLVLDQGCEILTVL
jgi:methionyl aminopeptidase